MSGRGGGGAHAPWATSFRSSEGSVVGILAWIVFGGLAVLVAGLLTGGGGGIVYDIIVGIVGAFLGGRLMSLIGQRGATGGGAVQWTSWTIARTCGTGRMQGMRQWPSL